MNSFIAWIGGKSNLRKIICDNMPEKFNRYIEVFGGAAWVMLHKEKHANMEVYNDYNGDLVNLFKCVKYHCPELQRELSFMLNSRELFYEFKQSYNLKGMTDIQRAARFFMVLKTSYGADIKSYGCIKKDISNMTKYLSDISERLSKVVIENRDFENLIDVYDKPDALIYCDPPYYGTEKYYQARFTIDDHRRLFKTLDNIKGKFMLSYNDCEFVRELYTDYNIIELQRQHNLRSRYEDADKIYSELLIKNY